jgi:hypothetical protein
LTVRQAAADLLRGLAVGGAAGGGGLGCRVAAEAMHDHELDGPVAAAVAEAVEAVAHRLPAGRG